LKVAFPVDILSPTARYEVQWGHVERPTHHNTSWDWARFETCGHKWVDLSEGGYGVALINDCKYGHDVRDNVIRLSLLRSPTEPDPEADQGEQRFGYRLFLHRGGDVAEVAREAYCFNDPVRVVGGTGEALGRGDAAPPRLYGEMIVAGPSNVIVETVKPAEDGRGVVVRFYEARRERGWVTLRFGFDVGEAWRTNLLEEDEERLEVTEAGVRLYVKPFEIVTVRVMPK
jgi:alpha-mannosidase